MKHALTGYSYQQQVTFLLLSIMDVKRSISKIEIEAITNDNFDDLIITNNSEIIQFQIKDFENIKLEDLSIQNDIIKINKRKPIKLSKSQNILFFKSLSFTPNDKIMGFESYRLSKNIYLISLSRVEIDREIDNLYQSNTQRRNEIDSFLNSILDKRIWEIPIESLPQLKIFITELQESSVLISHKLLDFNQLILIEGKPGIGKSHFVNTLLKEYESTILYRFWINNQDRDKEERLKFENFIRDINTKLFFDQETRSVESLLKKLKKEKKTFIIDGLDHVENYNKLELDTFIDFISKAKNYCKIIVLSRPLIKKIDWKKHTLENWNLKQTQKVLKELFHISEYSITKDIYKVSQGYPIIVKYIAEHYKLHKEIPIIHQVKNIDSYYKNIISDEKGTQNLSLFLCSKSYIMESEIDLFIGDEKYYINQFIKEHPYLFDVKLNRVSLFHDSFNTYLRKEVDYTHKTERINNIVCKSLLNLENRFLSRFSLFQLSKKQKKKIILKYSSITIFEKIIKKSIDYESLQSFYNQLRESIKEFSPNELSVINYYDLSLIINLVSREHLATLNEFNYTYVKSLIQNGITDEDITSSEYLFSMYYYIKTRNGGYYFII
ncbi:reticulocyte binding-like protein 2b [Nonlabens ulvanivorans]|nr:hypothetical protein [Nonlabens ulvanivorans]GAK89308.1 reticulocyte binding-like protein 2b [Nonlabens ulvanivorans]